jgi:hypothetical protein
MAEHEDKGRTSIFWLKGLGNYAVAAMNNAACRHIRPDDVPDPLRARRPVTGCRVASKIYVRRNFDEQPRTVFNQYQPSRT